MRGSAVKTPATSVLISHTVAPSSAASATAVVSEPPRPSVVTSMRITRDALEPGDQDDPVLIERSADPVRAHLEDPGLRVGRVGDDAGLRAGQGHSVVAHVVDRHRAERAGDALADREQHVHLALVRAIRDLVRHLDQVVRRLSARRQNGDHAASALARGDDPRCGALQVFRPGDGRAAELHDHDLAHGCTRWLGRSHPSEDNQAMPVPSLRASRDARCLSRSCSSGSALASGTS